MATTFAARRQTEELLCRAGVYPHARNAYQRLFNREEYLTRLRDRDFFRQFVPPESLVFDVGANEGRLTQTFTELGARVVAVEANPLLAEKVRARYGGRRVAVEAVAVGRECGVAELRLGVYNGHSTLSSDWQQRAGETRWEGSVEVPVATLDQLIGTYGQPAFVKIDVEGFEAEVLAGLHQAVPAISFEFICGVVDVAHRCLASVGELGEYELNLALGESHDLRLQTWTDAAGMGRKLERLAADEPGAYGDVYARLRRS
jgi:FkbM family methyltransferase